MGTKGEVNPLTRWIVREGTGRRTTSTRLYHWGHEMAPDGMGAVLVLSLCTSALPLRVTTTNTRTRCSLSAQRPVETRKSSHTAGHA